MIQDSLAIFATAQTNTLSVAHTDIIDTLALGDAYVNDWFVFLVVASATQTGTTSRLNVQLQTSDLATFADTDDVTLATSATYNAASLVAGRYWAVRIPPGVKRYIRAYNIVSRTIVGHSFDTISFSSFIAADIDNEINRRYLLVGV